jgi:hypothetical protein
MIVSASYGRPWKIRPKFTKERDSLLQLGRGFLPFLGRPWAHVFPNTFLPCLIGRTSRSFTLNVYESAPE